MLWLVLWLATVLRAVSASPLPPCHCLLLALLLMLLLLLLLQLSHLLLLMRLPVWLLLLRLAAQDQRRQGIVSTPSLKSDAVAVDAVVSTIGTPQARPSLPPPLCCTCPSAQALGGTLRSFPYA